MSDRTTWLVVSATAAEAQRLVGAGPRRDFEELRKATEGTCVFRETPRQGRSLRQRLFGPHVRQAWRVAALARDGDSIYADGEHNGIPLAVFLRLRRKRVARFVVLAHWVTPRWKRVALFLASIAGVPATLVVHSVVQQAAAESLVRKRWEVRLLPYLVDTDFWLPGSPERPSPDSPTVVAVGAENRDYTTLVTAAALLPEMQFVIAAGSHWARTLSASQDELPPNVIFISETLGFEELRELYGRATVVAVPLLKVENQSGVTAILEGMSMGLPVVTTANRGQREVVAGPLVQSDGVVDSVGTADRGPHLFTTEWQSGVTGCYAEVQNAQSLAAAIAYLSRNSTAGPTGRSTVAAHFRIEQFVERIGRLLEPSIARDTPLATVSALPTKTGEDVTSSPVTGPIVR